MPLMKAQVEKVKEIAEGIFKEKFKEVKSSLVPDADYIKEIEKKLSNSVMNIVQTKLDEFGKKLTQAKQPLKK